MLFTQSVWAVRGNEEWQSAEVGGDVQRVVGMVFKFPKEFGDDFITCHRVVS